MAMTKCVPDHAHHAERHDCSGHDEEYGPEAQPTATRTCRRRSASAPVVLRLVGERRRRRSDDQKRRRYQCSYEPTQSSTHPAHPPPRCADLRNSPPQSFQPSDLCALRHTTPPLLPPRGASPESMSTTRHRNGNGPSTAQERCPRSCLSGEGSSS